MKVPCQERKRLEKLGTLSVEFPGISQARKPDIETVSPKMEVTLVKLYGHTSRSQNVLHICYKIGFYKEQKRGDKSTKVHRTQRVT